MNSTKEQHLFKIEIICDKCLLSLLIHLKLNTSLLNKNTNFPQILLNGRVSHNIYFVFITEDIVYNRLLKLIQ